MDKLRHKVELLHRSSERLVRAAGIKRIDRTWWRFVRKESWIHLRRSLELFLMVLRRTR